MRLFDFVDKSQDIIAVPTQLPWFIIQDTSVNKLCRTEMASAAAAGQLLAMLEIIPVS